MRTLTTRTDSFDTLATFRLDIGKRPDLTCYVFTDKEEETVWLMSSVSCLRGSYTAEQTAELDRLNAEPPVKHGDEVLFDGRKYTVHVQGNFSDAGYLIPA
jgi:hypothetical protein